MVLRKLKQTSNRQNFPLIKARPCKVNCCLQLLLALALALNIRFNSQYIINCRVKSNNTTIAMQYNDKRKSIDLKTDTLKKNT